MLRAVLFMAAAALISVGAPSQAKRPANPFDGLMPKGFLVKTSPRPCKVADIAGSTIAIIPSKRFLSYIKTFSERKTRGGWPGASQTSNNFYVTSADPQLISDFIVELFHKNGVSLTISSDIASSLMDGSRYFLVLDFKSNYHAFGGGRYGTRDVEGGVHILDSNLSVCHSSTTSSSVALGEGQNLQDSNDGVLVYAMGIVRAHQAFQQSVEASMNRDLFSAD